MYCWWLPAYEDVEQRSNHYFFLIILSLSNQKYKIILNLSTALSHASSLPGGSYSTLRSPCQCHFLEEAFPDAAN